MSMTVIVTKKLTHCIIHRLEPNADFLDFAIWSYMSISLVLNVPFKFFLKPFKKSLVLNVMDLFPYRGTFGPPLVHACVLQGELLHRFSWWLHTFCRT